MLVESIRSVRNDETAAARDAPPAERQIGAARLTHGASLYELQVHLDHRGSLLALETATNLPFEPRRFFIVDMPHPGIPRAEHSCSAEQLLIVLRGRVAFEIDDGRACATVELAQGSRALRLMPGTWLRMIGREPGALLMVAASTAYSETQYFTTPRADLAVPQPGRQRAFIQQADPCSRLRLFETEIADAVRRVITGGRLVLGDEVERFEADFARYIGVGHCVGVNSGTDALAFALRALGVGPGDEVVTVALTAAGTAQAIVHCGAVPRFVDVDAASFCMDVAAAAAAIGPKVKAIVPVHLYGRPADVTALRALADRHGLALVEDCAQSHGATLAGRRLGAFGHATAFSFYPTKNLGALGDGGAVVTNDPAIAERVRSLRMYGWRADARICGGPGFNSRLDEVQAAILNVLLPHLDRANEARRAIAGRYRSRLGSAKVGMQADDPGAVYHQFAITTGGRDGLRRHLERRGIGTAVHYDPPLHRQPAFARCPADVLPVTERLAASLASLPIQPEIAADAVDRIAAAILEYEQE